jgi:hypothetical protein
MAMMMQLPVQLKAFQGRSRSTVLAAPFKKQLVVARAGKAPSPAPEKPRVAPAPFSAVPGEAQLHLLSIAKAS